MRVAFFHGLESSEKSEKSQYLKANFNAWCPAMDYKNPKLFDEVLAHIQSDKPDLLIGSSMGGWFAYCISTLTGIPTLLLNPAVQGRSLEPKVHLGNMKANHSVVLGIEDIVIDPAKTKSWFKGNCKGKYEFHMERIGHRTPNPIMVKHLKVNESLNERKLPDFQYPWTIIASHNGNSRVQFSGTGDHYIVKFNALNPKSTLCFFESDKLKSAGNGINSLSEVSKVLSTVQSIMEEYLQTNPKSTIYFVGAASSGENPEEGEMTKRGRIYLDLIKDNIKLGFHWKMAKDGVGMLIALDDTALFENVNEEWSTESPGDGAAINILPEGLQDFAVPNFLGSRPFQNIGMAMTVENNKEISKVVNAQKNLSDGDIAFVIQAANETVDVFYTWLVVRGQKVNRAEISSIWNDPKTLDVIRTMKDQVKRSRPYWISSDINLIPNTGASDYSYPSGHSIGAWMIAKKMTKKFPHLEDGLNALAHRVAQSRVQAGVHFPSDIEPGKDIADRLIGLGY